MSTVAATTTPMTVPTAAATYADAGTKWPIGVSPDGATLYGTDSTGNLYESTDFQATWSASLHQFVITGPIESIKTMANGEVVVAANDGKIWVSSGWPASHAGATWTNPVSTAQAGARYPGRYGGVHVAPNPDDPTKSIVTVGQWGSHTNDVTPATNAALYADQSRDNGLTWTRIFDLLSSLNPALVAAGLTPFDAATANLHTHSACYDWINRRSLVCFGDNQSGNLKAKGLAPIAYKDDDAANWQLIPWPNGYDDGSSAIWQCTGPVVLDSCILFFSDGPPHGPIRLGRAGYRKYTPLEILTASNGGSTGMTGRRSQEPRQPGLPAILTAYDANPVGTDVVITTTDGYEFREIIRHAEPLTVAAVSAGGRTAGPESAFLTSDGLIRGAMNDGAFAVATKFSVPYSE